MSMSRYDPDSDPRDPDSDPGPKRGGDRVRREALPGEADGD